MRKKIEEYINKYENIENLNLYGSQEEKDDFFLTARAIQISYDEHFLQPQHNIDNFIKKFIYNQELASFFHFDVSHPFFSPFASIKFQGTTNYYVPQAYLEQFPKETQFNSIFQYLLFHKAVLFLDREMALDILENQNALELVKLENRIRNVEKVVWSKYRIDIAEKAIQQIIKANPEFSDILQKTDDCILVFEFKDNYWGVDTSTSVEYTGLGQNNYLGKILTKQRTELSRNSEFFRE